MSDKDYFGGLNIIDEDMRAMQRCYTRRIIAAIVVGILLAAGTIYYAPKALAEPRYKAEEGPVSIVFHDEPCALTDFITNLGFRAVWHEGGQSFEGCWGVRTDMGLAVAYFSDKTVALVPLQALKQLRGA